MTPSARWTPPTGWAMYRRGLTLTARTLAAPALAALALAACSDSPFGPPAPGPDATTEETAAPTILTGPTVTATATSAVVRWTTDRSALGSIAATGPTDAATDAARATVEHRLPLFNLRPASSYSVTVQAADPADPTRTSQATVPFNTESAPPRRKVLFDKAHGETSANANWVIDEQDRFPTPASPTSESAWSGNYSAFAYDLWRSGRFEVESFAQGSLTYGSANAQDLANYDLLVLPEPNSWSFPTDNSCGAECLAVLAFVRAGGGLLAIGDHPNSDRDGDLLDSVDILNRIFAFGGVGLSIDAPKGNMTTQPCSSDVDPDPVAPVVRGPWGNVGCVAFYSGGALLADPTKNPSARHVLWFTGASGNNFGMVGVAAFDQGRIVLVGDSSAAVDGSPTLSAGRVEPWDNAALGNRALFLNAMGWLAGEY